MSSDATAAGLGGNPVSSHRGDHVNLRVTYLHAGNPRPPHSLGAISISTTVGDLKSRLQNDLLEHPRPEEQRLIYQGRPLMQNTITLKDALRLEEPVGPLPYTIHIIIQPRQAAPHYRPADTPNVPLPPGLSADGQPPANPIGGTSLEHHQRALQTIMTNLAQVQQNLAAQLPNVQTHFQINAVPLRPGQQPLPPFQPPNIQQMPAPQPPPPGNQAIPLPSSPFLHPSIQQTGPPGTHALPNSTSMRNLNVPSTMPPFQRPSSAPGHPRHRHTASVAARVPSQPPPGFTPLTQGLPPVPNLPHPFTAPITASNPPSQPTVWLASSRSGPEALLFAPGHGFFSSRPQQQHRHHHHLQHHHATANRGSQQAIPATANQPAANRLAPVPANGPNGQLAVQAPPPAGGRPQAPGRPRVQAQNDDEILAIVMQRIWLFLRLYMFIIFLSEANTWRRYGLLLLAAVVCLLPRQNPFNNAMIGARQHLDNLIGPQQPPARQRQGNGGRPQPQQDSERAAQGPQAGSAAAPPASASSSTVVRGAANVTPEEAARRLVRQRQEQNPNVIRDTLYRIEQASALFLASLIPGVGERHVAAREEARREEERIRLEAQRAREEEAEKKRKEEEEKANEAETSEKPNEAGESSTSGQGEKPPAASTEVSTQPPHEDLVDQDEDTRAAFT